MKYLVIATRDREVEEFQWAVQGSMFLLIQLSKGNTKRMKKRGGQETGERSGEVRGESEGKCNYF